MTLLRADLATYLDGQFSALATAALPGPLPPVVLYGAAIDQTLRTMGTAQADLPTATFLDAQASDAIVLAEYYSLVGIERAMALNVDQSLGAGLASEKTGQLFTNVHALVVQARADVVARGYLDQSWEMGRLSLDFLEPIQGWQ